MAWRGMAIAWELFGIGEIIVCRIILHHKEAAHRVRRRGRADGTHGTSGLSWRGYAAWILYSLSSWVSRHSEAIGDQGRE